MSEQWIKAEDLVGQPGMPDTLEGVEEVARMMEWESRPSLDGLIDSIEQSLAFLDDQDAENLVLTIWSLIVGIDDHFDALFDGGEPAVELGREMISDRTSDGLSRRAAIEELFANSVGIFDDLPEDVARVLAHHAKRLVDLFALCRKPERCHG